jgi:hypothetical protein
LRVGEERVDVVARAIPAERAALDKLEDLTIASRDGAAVPVTQVARVIRVRDLRRLPPLLRPPAASSRPRSAAATPPSARARQTLQADAPHVLFGIWGAAGPQASK